MAVHVSKPTNDVVHKVRHLENALDTYQPTEVCDHFFT